MLNRPIYWFFLGVENRGTIASLRLQTSVFRTSKPNLLSKSVPRISMLTALAPMVENPHSLGSGKVTEGG